jgi:hypothetical protein
LTLDMRAPYEGLLTQIYSILTRSVHNHFVRIANTQVDTPLVLMPQA